MSAGTADRSRPARTTSGSMSPRPTVRRRRLLYRPCHTKRHQADRGCLSQGHLYRPQNRPRAALSTLLAGRPRTREALSARDVPKRRRRERQRQREAAVRCRRHHRPGQTGGTRGIPRSFSRGGADCRWWWRPGATRLVDLPIWAFHCEDDPVVPVRYSRQSIATLRARWSPALFRIPIGRFLDPYEHYAWVPAYADPALRDCSFGSRSLEGSRVRPRDDCQSSQRRFWCRPPWCAGRTRRISAPATCDEARTRRASSSNYLFDIRWLRGQDLNLRPLGYEPNELPDCSTSRLRGRG